jgi:hypothetical protein
MAVTIMQPGVKSMVIGAMSRLVPKIFPPTLVQMTKWTVRTSCLGRFSYVDVKRVQLTAGSRCLAQRHLGGKINDHFEAI